MTKKTRLLILLGCIILFLLAAPYIVLYSLGYRVDFLHRKIVATGGIYVKALPQGVTIKVDSNTTTTGLLNSYVFVKNLLPSNYSVSITKSGYFDYQKTLPVTEKEVTKLETVTLFKQKYLFTSLFNFSEKQSKRSIVTWSDDSKRAIISENNDYFLLNLSLEPATVTPLPVLTGAKDIHFNAQNTSELFFLKNGNLYSTLQTAPIESGVIAYMVNNQTVTWLGADGLLYTTNIPIALTTKMTLQPLPIKKTTTYTLKSIAGNTYLQNGTTLLRFSPTTALFENVYTPVTALILSPNASHLLYCNDHEILVSLSNGKNIVSINKVSGLVKDCSWVNDNYVMYSVNDSILISETNTQGNVNTIILPSTITLPNNTIIAIQAPQLVINQQDKKLYLFTQNQLFSSERLVP